MNDPTLASSCSAHSCLSIKGAANADAGRADFERDYGPQPPPPGHAAHRRRALPPTLRHYLHGGRRQPPPVPRGNERTSIGGDAHVSPVNGLPSAGICPWSRRQHYPTNHRYFRSIRRGYRVKSKVKMLKVFRLDRNHHHHQKPPRRFASASCWRMSLFKRCGLVLYDDGGAPVAAGFAATSAA